jgi:TolB-like protein/DNA-binding winged helix-turn-helix (wHTH) protein/Tfp pilus assembly protein PilF
VAPHPRIVRFGSFELDSQSGELRKHGLKIKLQQKPLRALKILIERSGEVVTREELQRSLWPEGVHVDFDHNLNTAVRKLRTALGDTASAPRYVATIERQGYRFLLPTQSIGLTVETPEYVSEAPVAPLSPIAEAIPHTIVSQGSAFSGRPWMWIGVAAAFIVLIIVSLAVLWFRSSSHSSKTPSRFLLAVLPFENLTGDPAQDYFSDGLTEEMIDQLGHASPQRFGVIARSSVMEYKDKKTSPLQHIGKELGVQYVLEGSVQREAQRVRIATRLIQVNDRTQLWSREYDRELTDLLSVEREIAHEIADELTLTLARDHSHSAQSAVLSPAGYESYDLYLKGRYFWNKRNPEDLQQAVKCFQEAIAKNPQDARAYAGLADAYAMIGGYNLAPALKVMPLARIAALRALQLNDSLAEAHTSLAIVAENYDWDWATAENEYRRAIQLNPNYATAHHWYAEFLAFQGRFDAAWQENETARRLDPLSLTIAADNAAIFYYSRQYDHAIEHFRSVLDLDPSVPRAYFIIAAYAQKGNYKEALGTLKNWRRVGDGPWTSAWEAYIYGRAGDDAKAKAALRKLEIAMRNGETIPSMFVLAYLGMNQPDRALSWLEKDYANHTNLPTGFKVDPIYDPLRGDSRFQNLLRRVHLED